MATEVKRRRGTTVEHSTFTGAVAELTVDLTKDTVVVHDGATQAGFPLLREDFSNAIFTVPDARYLLESNNLSDLDNVSTARDNLELGASDDVTFNTVTADLIGDVTGNVTGDVTGDLTGAIHVQGKNDTGGTLTKGTPVYISGQVAQGQQFTIGVADSDGSGTMPSIGILSANVNDNAMGDIVTHGKLIGIDTSSFTVGDELFIGSNGTLVNTPPTGESNLLQKIAKVIRVDGSSGQIYIMGAGRTNAVPNLDEGKIFAGDANNQAVTTDVIDVNIASGLVTINDDLTVNGIIITDEIDTTSIVWNTSTQVWDATPSEKFNNPVFIGTSLDVDNGINADQHVHAGTYLKADTYLEVGTSATIGGTLSVTGNTTISGTLDAPTLNTGQGDNELYAMNQNVQTSDSVTFGALTVSGATILSSTLQVDGTITVNDDIETADFSSWFTTTPSGFQISQAGVGDFRTLYIDELVAKAFTADVAQALAGSDILTKSVAKLNASFVVPSVGASVSITVEDLEGLSGLQVFEAGDHVRARVVDSTSGLEIFDIYGTVSNYASVSGGTQTWDYTITYAGASNGAVGKTVNKGNILLDYGTSGSYYIERTVLDRSTESSDDFTKVPYNRIVQWTNTVSGSPRAGDPDTVITVITQSGNLANLTSTYSNVSGFGFFGDNTFLTGSLLVGDLSKAGNYLEYNGSALNVVTGTFNLATPTLVIDSTNNKLALGTSASAITIDGTEVGFIADGAGEFKAYADANNYIRLANSALDIKAESFDLETSTVVLNSASNGRLIVGADADNQLVDDGVGFFVTGDGNFRVGTIQQGTDSYIKFDGSTVSILTNTFDLATSTLVVDSDDNKIALGSSADSITIDGNEVGFIADGTGEFKAFLDANNFIRLANSSLNIKAQKFNLESSTIQLGDSIELTSSEITSSNDYSGSTLVFSGLFNNTYNYFGYLEDIDDVVPDGYVFRVGDATNFMELNTSNNVAKIKFDTFTLDTTASGGGIDIDSTSQTIKLEDANKVRTQVDITNGSPSVSVDVNQSISAQTITDLSDYETTAGTYYNVDIGDAVEVFVTASLTTLTNAGGGSFIVYLYGGNSSTSATNELARKRSQIISSGSTSLYVTAYSYTYDYFKVIIEADIYDPGDPATPTPAVTFTTSTFTVKSYESQTRIALDGVYVNNDSTQYARLTRDSNKLSGLTILDNLPTGNPEITGALYRNGTVVNTSRRSDNLVVLDNLPTSDPEVVGALWNSSGTLKISAG